MSEGAKLTPEWFAKHSLLNEARQQIHHAIARSSGFDLDKSTAFWIVRMEGWRDLARDLEFNIFATGYPRKTLLGLPVRISIDDEPDVPLIQLVMEPMARAPR